MANPPKEIARDHLSGQKGSTFYFLLLGSGIPVVFFLTTMVCGWILGDYNHLTRMVSELGALGTPSRYAILGRADRVFGTEPAVCHWIIQDLQGHRDKHASGASHLVLHHFHRRGWDLPIAPQIASHPGDALDSARPFPIVELALVDQGPAVAAPPAHVPGQSLRHVPGIPGFHAEHFERPSWIEAAAVPCRLVHLVCLPQLWIYPNQRSKPPTLSGCLVPAPRGFWVGHRSHNGAKSYRHVKVAPTAMNRGGRRPLPRPMGHSPTRLPRRPAASSQ